MEINKRVIPCLFVIFAGLYCGAKIVQYYSFAINDYDTGIYTNLAWNIIHGNGYYSAVMDRNHLGDHFSPIMFLIAPLYLFIPSALIILIIQGMSAALTLSLVALLAREILEIGEYKNQHLHILFIVILFFLYKPMNSAIHFHFHPSTLAMPIIAGAILCLHRGRPMLFWILVCLLLTTKENAPLALMGIGVYVGLVLSKRRLAVELVTLAVLFAILIFVIIMPAFRDGYWGHYSRIGPMEHLNAKVAYLILLLTPLSLLPLLHCRSLVAAAPLVLLNLSVNFTEQFSREAHYDDMISVFLIISAIHGYNKFLYLINTQVKNHHNRLISWMAHVLILLVALAQIGSLPVTVMLKKWPKDQHVALLKELKPYMHMPIEQPIIAQSGLGPYVSHRYHYRMLNKEFSKVDFPKGTLVLISPVAVKFMLNYEAAIAILDASARCQLIHSSEVLKVYLVTDTS